MTGHSLWHKKYPDALHCNNTIIMTIKYNDDENDENCVKEIEEPLRLPTTYLQFNGTLNK